MNPNQELIDGVLENDIAKVRQALQAGASVDDARASDHFGEPTPLMHAVRLKDTDMVKVLLKNGARVDARDDCERTALMWAGSEGAEGGTEAVKILVEAGAELNLQDELGNTALIYGANNQKLEAVKALIEAGAEVDARDNDGRTGLMWAGRWGLTDTVETLIASGADVNLQDNDGRTALMWAAAWSGASSILPLLEAGADLELKDGLGCRVEDYVRSSGVMDSEGVAACLEIIQTAQAARRASALDRQLAQACDSWTPPTASSKQPACLRDTPTDKQGQAQQEVPVTRTRQRL